MKTIGLLGGMSWESTVEYYRIINEEVKKRLGGTHSAKIILNSVNFHEIETLQHKGNWAKLTEMMIHEAKVLEKAGADCLVICTNTMHRMADTIIEHISIPLIHIADATANSVKKKDIGKIGLLGTKYTMEGDFYKGRLVEKHRLDVTIPNEKGRKIIHDIIYEELIFGKITEESRQEYIKIINELIEDGSKGIILGCTEIGLLVKPEHSSVSLFDTTEIHAIAAVDFAMS